MRHLAQIRLAPEGGFKGFGPLGLEDRSASDAPLIFNTFIRAVIGLLTIVAFIYFLFLLITGAISILSSGGDKSKLSEAKSRITMGFVGLVIVIAAVFIADLIGSILGIDILGGALLLPQLFNP